MAPIKVENLVMREFVIIDVRALVQAGLAHTSRAAEELAVEIIRNAGMTKGKHAELVVLVVLAREGERGDGGEDCDARMVGRVGVRII
jgi:hypothetical protein